MKLRLPLPGRMSSVPEIDQEATGHFTAVLDLVQKWANGGIGSDNITDGSLLFTDFLSAAWSTYTSTWASSGTQPALGNGTLSGRYVQISKLVIVHIDLTAGTTTTFGTGAWNFTLPVTSTSLFRNGTAVCVDSSAGATYAALANHATTTQVQMFTLAQPGAFITNLVPFTWATSDNLTIDLVYEAA